MLGWPTKSERAAAVKLPSWTTAWKHRSCLKLIFWRKSIAALHVGCGQGHLSTFGG